VDVIESAKMYQDALADRDKRCAEILNESVNGKLFQFEYEVRGQKYVQVLRPYKRDTINEDALWCRIMVGIADTWCERGDSTLMNHVHLKDHAP
jgi:hypothetical protein